MPQKLQTVTVRDLTAATAQNTFQMVNNSQELLFRQLNLSSVKLCRVSDAQKDKRDYIITSLIFGKWVQRILKWVFKENHNVYYYNNLKNLDCEIRNSQPSLSKFLEQPVPKG